MISNGIQLSIIIVNYNVKFFLEQCLNSVFKASHKINAEIFVVDNNSVDGSMNMVREKFPKVILIENKSNLGFSKANNQAIRRATGKYILMLNPDTVIEETTFEKCIEFMDDHPEAGAIGVKMIDGKGNFLPESKRSLPTPSIAFYKIFGFSALFPRSRTFGRYHLGYLDKNHTHEVEILTGAFMFLRKEALDKVGLLDEDYFMYGEDVDLSYRLIKAGYKNYYYPESTIIHYKGESTKKGSLNYVFTFYNAMIIFARKNFPDRNARLFSNIINLAIYFRAFLSIAKRTYNAAALPLFEALIVFFGYYLLLPVWAKFIFSGQGSYPPEYLIFIVPAYIGLWIVSLYFSGGYMKPSKIWFLFRGILTGTIIILIIYALLPASLRFSRALILIGAGWFFVAALSLRLLLQLVFKVSSLIELNQKKRLLIAGQEKECERVLNLIHQTRIKHELVGFVNPGMETMRGNYIGNLTQLEEIVRVNEVQEIIFCSKDIPSRDIIQYMLNLSESRVDYKIAPQESISIIGSNSIDSPGELYVLDFNLIARSANKRIKRLFDFITALALLLISPFILFFYRNPLRFLANTLKVIAGLNSWVGYGNSPNLKDANLPPLKTGILSPYSGLHSELSIEQIDKLNLLYARDYKVMNDLKFMLRGFRELDSTHDQINNTR